MKKQEKRILCLSLALIFVMVLTFLPWATQWKNAEGEVFYADFYRMVARTGAIHFPIFGLLTLVGLFGVAFVNKKRAAFSGVVLLLAVLQTMVFAVLDHFSGFGILTAAIVALQCGIAVACLLWHE